MALGTITPVQIIPENANGPANVGGLKMTVTNVVPSTGADYPTGGVPITPQQLGLLYVLAGQAEIFASTGTNATGVACAVIPSNGGAAVNLKFFTSANAEVANGVQLTGETVQIIAFGY